MALNYENEIQILEKENQSLKQKILTLPPSKLLAL